MSPAAWLAVAAQLGLTNCGDGFQPCPWKGRAAQPEAKRQRSHGAAWDTGSNASRRREGKMRGQAKLRNWKITFR